MFSWLRFLTNCCKDNLLESCHKFQSCCGLSLYHKFHLYQVFQYNHKNCRQKNPYIVNHFPTKKINHAITHFHCQRRHLFFEMFCKEENRELDSNKENTFQANHRSEIFNWKINCSPKKNRRLFNEWKRILWLH